jgi:hypothetical protein
VSRASRARSCGREVGISAESIALAARTLGQGVGEAPAARTVLGLPVGVARTVYLDRKLTVNDPVDFAPARST